MVVCVCVCVQVHMNLTTHSWDALHRGMCRDYGNLGKKCSRIRQIVGKRIICVVVVVVVEEVVVAATPWIIITHVAQCVHIYFHLVVNTFAVSALNVIILLFVFYYGLSQGRRATEIDAHFANNYCVVLFDRTFYTCWCVSCSRCSLGMRARNSCVYSLRIYLDMFKYL